MPDSTQKNNNLAVLLSAYNGGKYIKKQVESILDQENINNFTIYIRDDGSTDNTRNILKHLQKENPNIKVIEGKNIGLVASFLELLNLAYQNRYDYYSFSDQDDYWLPEKLATAVRAIEKIDEPVLYASCSKIVNENLQSMGCETQKKLRDITFYNSAIQNFCPGHNQVINNQLAKCILEHTIYSPKIYSHDLWITNVAAVRGKIIFDNESHALYRQHMDNQLSYGKSKFEWVVDHLRRLRRQESRKMAVQLKYFCECYYDYLSKEERTEITSFFNTENILQRLNYVIHTKLYRQKRYETFLFKLLYVFGSYKA